mmetsp:Transcript_10044/g.22169  ORF Transcript_10044/g.22169 Transcript_10044/m.22169 type:complete len:272 (-) Transcript_10044:744-1559(-)
MSVPRRMPPSRKTSSLSLRPASSKVAVISASAWRVGRTWSNCLPPWLETRIPSSPCWAARTASSPVCTPFKRIFILPWVTCRNQAKSFQFQEASVKLPRAPMTPPAVVASVLCSLATADLSLSLFRWSLSRRPTTLQSTVTKRVVTPAANTRWSMASDLCRSGLMQIWYHWVCPGTRSATMSSKSRVAMLAMHWTMPNFPAARAKAHSPSACAMPAIAAGEKKRGKEEWLPNRQVEVFTLETSTMILGLNHTRLKTSQFARLVTSSHAAEA